MISLASLSLSASLIATRLTSWPLKNSSNVALFFTATTCCHCPRIQTPRMYTFVPSLKECAGGFRCRKRMARGSCTRSISAVISRTFFGLETSRRWGSRGCTLTSSTHRAFWPSQGQYTLADGEPTENQSMAEAESWYRTVRFVCCVLCGSISSRRNLRTINARNVPASVCQQYC